MCTSYSSIDRANRLRADMCDVIAKIHSAENGNRIEREQFLALLTRKNTIIAEANSIINEVNQTLNLAASDPNERVPYHLYLALTNARKIARMVVKTAHTTPTCSSPDSQVPSTSTATPRVNFFGSLNCHVDEDLPF